MPDHSSAGQHAARVPRASKRIAHRPTLYPHNDLQPTIHQFDNSPVMPFNPRTTPAHQPVFELLDTSAILFVTICTAQRCPILASDHVHRALISAWKSANKWSVGRYVMMPSHIHFFCAPSTFPCEPLRKWIGYWKRIFSREWSSNSSPPKWHRDLWDTQLRRSDSYQDKWEYVRMNPVRAKLVAHPDDWPYQGELSVLPWIEQA